MVNEQWSVINVEESNLFTQMTQKSVQIPQSAFRNPQSAHFSDLSDDLFGLEVSQTDGT
jgi:hypothetical protein